MTRYRATLAYDGTAYVGFQKQAVRPTIQGETETALERVLGITTPIIGAGRTDTGVHAIGQVIAFNANWGHAPDALLTAVNVFLPNDIVLQNLEVTETTFHPRHDALSRSYRYDVAVSPRANPLQSRFVWHKSSPLSLDLLNEGASLLIGEHDFATFGKPPIGDNTVRKVLNSVWTVDETKMLYSYHIEGTAFLHHMVRRIVQMLVDVGRGWLSVPTFKRAFALANLKYAGKIAPPQGLVLVEVRYPPLTKPKENG